MSKSIFNQNLLPIPKSSMPVVLWYCEKNPLLKSFVQLCDDTNDADLTTSDYQALLQESLKQVERFEKRKQLTALSKERLQLIQVIQYRLELLYRSGDFPKILTFCLALLSQLQRLFPLYFEESTALQRSWGQIKKLIFIAPHHPLAPALKKHYLEGMIETIIDTAKSTNWVFKDFLLYLAAWLPESGDKKRGAKVWSVNEEEMERYLPSQKRLDWEYFGMRTGVLKIEDVTDPVAAAIQSLNDNDESWLIPLWNYLTQAQLKEIDPTIRVASIRHPLLRKEISLSTTITSSLLDMSYDYRITEQALQQRNIDLELLDSQIANDLHAIICREVILGNGEELLDIMNNQNSWSNLPYLVHVWTDQGRSGALALLMAIYNRHLENHAMTIARKTVHNSFRTLYGILNREQYLEWSEALEKMFTARVNA